jgi:DNA mismatch endonuclease (patch repair protein)
MTDVHDPQTRSYNMSRIRSKDTKPEMLVRKYLFARGFRYRLHDKKLPGKPDLVFPKYRTVLFINGCFWHGHEGCKYFVIPQTNTDRWTEKIRTNKANDEKKSRILTEAGWKVITIWECELKGPQKEATLNALKKRLSR